jgi:Transposase DDE domain
VSAQSLQIQRPTNCLKTLPAKLTVNFVHVREVETNGENAPIEWMIAITEPIATGADLERIIDIYGARWVIEEYFKSLKNGLRFREATARERAHDFERTRVIHPHRMATLVAASTLS